MGGGEQSTNNHKQLICQDIALNAEELDTRRGIAENRKLHLYSGTVAASLAIVQPNAGHLHQSNSSGKNHRGAKGKENERTKVKEKATTKAKERPKESLAVK